MYVHLSLTCICFFLNWKTQFLGCFDYAISYNMQIDNRVQEEQQMKDGETCCIAAAIILDTKDRDWGRYLWNKREVKTHIDSVMLYFVSLTFMSLECLTLFNVK